MAGFDLHGRALVKLDADEAGGVAPGGIVVDQHAGDTAVEQLDDGVAAGDEVKIVPILALDQLLQLLAIAHRADERGFFALADIGELAAHGEKPAPALFVDLAGVLLLAIHVGLVALHGELDIGEFDAANLDAAIEAGEFELELQFEIRRTAAAPDEEGVLDGLPVGGGLSDDGAVFHAPEMRIAFPAGEGFAVDDGLVGGFLDAREHGPASGLLGVADIHRRDAENAEEPQSSWHGPRPWWNGMGKPRRMPPRMGAAPGGAPPGRLRYGASTKNQRVTERKARGEESA